MGIQYLSTDQGTFPIDTSKTRLQVQGQVINSSLEETRYRGMLHAIYRISREEGVTALYNGIKPALLRQATYGTFKIGLYHTIKRAIVENPRDETLASNIFGGIMAGAISSAICNPTDVLKVRLQAQTAGTVAVNRGMLISFVDIYRMEGLSGLYRGVGPTAQRASVVAGVELPVYDFSKRHIVESQILGDSPANHFISSIIAGLAGAVASNPIDVIKTRMMNQRKVASSAGLYTGSIDCALRTCRTEGVMALYKGFIPTFVRLGPWNIIFFMSFEQLKKLDQGLTHS